MNRVSPSNIKELKPDEVFVFGSNEAGNHGRGAALTARRWGARKSVAAGFSGQTYAIPTKPADVRYRLSLRDISRYVDDFVRFASAHPHLHFLVTEIGCGLAGYKPNEIAPLFVNCAQLPNVALPASFWRVLS
ncbi:MAG: hypothetical protein E6Q97_11335 [Desulfurellales bacterium]|nr:MAG: hypothetical protein E6Q97_11335 [Desulfurellales bacterium]